MLIMVYYYPCEGQSVVRRCKIKSANTLHICGNKHTYVRITLLQHN